MKAAVIKEITVVYLAYGYGVLSIRSSIDTVNGTIASSCLPVPPSLPTSIQPPLYLYNHSSVHPLLWLASNRKCDPNNIAVLGRSVL